jgi:glycosyltransferase involved in cell wall biosynthesis
MTFQPIITVIVPTIGRPSLAATLESLAAQRLAKYIEVLVVPDTHKRAVPLPILPTGLARIEIMDYDAGFSAWGHPQRNFAMPQAHGIWVATLDDDDVWTPGALDIIVGGVSSAPQPFHIFKMRHHESGVIIWNRRYPSQGNVGTPMFVWKNGTQVGQWGRAYEGDFNFVASSIHAMPNGVDDLYWHDAVIATIRPVGPPAGVQTW